MVEILQITGNLSYASLVPKGSILSISYVNLMLKHPASNCCSEYFTFQLHDTTVQ